MIPMRRNVAGILALLLATAVVPVPACNPKAAQIDAILTSAMTYHQQGLSTMHTLAQAAALMIPSLPAEQQPQYRELLQKLTADGDAIAQALGDAIRAAKEQNAEKFDIVPFALRWANIIQELITLGSRLKVERQLLDQGSAQVMKLKAVR